MDIKVGGSSIHSILYYIRNFFFTVDGSALWFIEALIWAVIIVAVLTRWLNIKLYLLLALFFLVSYCFSTLLGVTGECVIIKTLQPIITYTGIQGPTILGFPLCDYGFYDG